VEPPLPEEADRVAAEDEDRLDALPPAAGKDQVDPPLGLAPGLDPREEERRRLSRDLREEGRLRALRPVLEAHLEPRRLAREDLGRAVERHHDRVHVPPRDDPRDEEDAEEEREEDVEAVVAGVRRPDRDDEGGQDVAEAEVRDADEDRLVPGDLQAEPEDRQLHGIPPPRAQSGTATSSRIFCTASRSRRPAPVPS
jgi:hypothetical protein